jgi:hypothetical protein
LGERAVADHVGKHNGSELALFGRRHHVSLLTISINDNAAGEN